MCIRDRELAFGCENLGLPREETIDRIAKAAKELELVNYLNRRATGGPGMVKAAYSSGKPALGVGPGNTPVIIDDSAAYVAFEVLYEAWNN